MHAVRGTGMPYLIATVCTLDLENTVAERETSHTMEAAVS